MYGKVVINNTPSGVCKYIVATFDDKCCEFWFWGSWDDKSKADKVAYEIGGVVLERLD